MPKNKKISSDFLSVNYLRSTLLLLGIKSLVIRLSAVFVSVISSIVLARSLGPTGFGVYAFSFAILSILAIPVQLGLPTLVLRETAQAHAKSNWARMKGIWRWATTRILITSLVIIIITIAIITIIAPITEFESQTVITFLFGLPLIPFIALGLARGAALKGLQRVIQGQFPDDVLRPGLLALFVYVTFSLTVDYITPSNTMILHVISAMIAFVVGYILLARAQPLELVNTTQIIMDKSNWSKSILPLAAISGLQVINQQTDLIMLGLFRTADETGLYKVAISGSTLSIFGLQVVNMVIAPQFARLYSLKKIKTLANLAAWGSLASLVLSLPILIIFIFFGKEILSLMYGDAYLDAYIPLLVLSLGQAFSAFFGSCTSLLNMSGHERDSLNTFGVAALVNISLNAFLIPLFGVVGAATATATSLVLLNFLLWFKVRNKLGIDSSATAILSVSKKI